MNTILDASINYILEDYLAEYRNLILEYCHKPSVYARGTRLSECGKPVKCVYFLVDGMVKMYTNNAFGYTRIVGYHKQNTIFAMDNLETGALTVVTAESVTPITVVPLYEEDLLRLNHLDDSFLPRLLHYYCYVLRLMCVDAENQSIGDTGTRFINFLCIYMRSKEYGQQGYVAMSQEELASAVNASRVQIARICAKLRDQGLLQLGRRQIHILNEERLLALADLNMHSREPRLKVQSQVS